MKKKRHRKIWSQGDERGRCLLHQPKSPADGITHKNSCSKARRLHREEMKLQTSSHLTTQSVISALKTPTDPRESVVKEQVGFNLQTGRLTPVNLKFIKFITPSPNVLWEFSPSKVNAPRTAPLFIHVLSFITASLDLVCQHSPGAKFYSWRAEWERKSIGSGWGPIPLLEVFHLGCFLLPQLKAPCHVTGDHIHKVSAFCQTFFKEGNQHEKDSLSCLHVRGKKGCLFLAVTTAFPEKERHSQNTCQLSLAQKSDVCLLPLSLSSHLQNFPKASHWYCVDEIRNKSLFTKTYVWVLFTKSYV